MINLSLLGMDMSTVGLICTGAIGLILLAFVIWGVVAGIKKSALTFVVALVALAVAVFASKPLLSLFDNWFNFSLIFVNFFFAMLNPISSFNVVVDSSTLASETTVFANSDVGIASWIKNFLVEVFGKTKIPQGTSTTLGLISAKVFSYFTSLFIVALILFVVTYVVLSLILKKFVKISKDKKVVQRIFGGVVGLVYGGVVSLALLILFSTVPFFGVSNDYLSEGFKKTKILDSAYAYIQKTEDELYLNQIDWKTTNANIFGNKEDISKIYGNETTAETDKYYVKINIDSSNYVWTESLYIKAQSKVYTQTHKYVYSNQKMYLFDDKTLYATYLVKNKKINYSAIINSSGTEETYNTTLVGITEPTVTVGIYNIEKVTQDGTELDIADFDGYSLNLTENQVTRNDGALVSYVYSLLNINGNYYFCTKSGNDYTIVNRIIYDSSTQEITFVDGTKTMIYQKY